MSKTLLAAIAAAAVFSSAMFDGRADAMPPAPSAFGLAGASGSMLSRVAIVCSVGGCSPVNVKRVWHPPRGFVQRAAPLNMPRANPPPQQNASTNK